MARTVRAGFPRSLDGAPILLPTADTALRRALDQWLNRHALRPVVLAEFEDSGLLREFARRGHGVAPVLSVQQEQFRRELGLARVGRADGVRAEFYAVVAERRIKHPAVAAVVEHARQLLAQ